MYRVSFPLCNDSHTFPCSDLDTVELSIVVSVCGGVVLIVFLIWACICCAFCSAEWKSWKVLEFNVHSIHARTCVCLPCIVEYLIHICSYAKSVYLLKYLMYSMDKGKVMLHLYI